MSETVWPRLEQLHTIAFDFDGVFTDNKVYVDQDGRESVRCDRGDGLGLDMLRRYCELHDLNIDLVIVSKERNQVVQARAQKLRLACRHGIGDKLSALTEYLAERRATEADPFGGLLFVGNDLNDLAVGCRAGFFVVPADAHPVVRQHASAVVPISGGNGFVRALVEQLIAADNLSVEELDELVSDRRNRDQP